MNRRSACWWRWTPSPTVTSAQLSEAGVKRISVGGSLSRFALGAFLKAAREMKEQGAFTFVRDAAPSKELKAAFARGAAAVGDRFSASLR